MSENSIEIKQQRINNWLHHHTEYQVIIYLDSLYGCISCSITKNAHFDYKTNIFTYETVKSWLGVHLEKRLDQVIDYLKIDEWEGPYKWWKSREENIKDGWKPR